MNIEGFRPNTAMFIRPWLLVPSGWSGHVPFGAWLIASAEPKTLFELGSHRGMSYAAFCQTIQSSRLVTKCFAVDTWQGDEHAGFYGDEIYRDLADFNARHFSGFSSLMRMRFDEAANYFAERSVDVLHIDGLHTYEAVKLDFETWLPKLSDSAVVLFHDTNIRDKDFGVWKYWAEISREYPSVEFDHSAGLGVLFVGKNQKSELQEFIEAARDQRQFANIKEIFSSLGESVLRRWEAEDTGKRLAEKTHDVERVLAQMDRLSSSLAEADDDRRRAAAFLDAAESQRREDEQRIASLAQQVRTLTQNNESLNERNESLMLQVQDEARRVEQAVSRAARLESSFSYRVTKPLRFVRGLFNR